MTRIRLMQVASILSSRIQNSPSFNMEPSVGRRLSIKEEAGEDPGRDEPRQHAIPVLRYGNAAGSSAPDCLHCD
jgi:hypothetical protein